MTPIEAKRKGDGLVNFNMRLCKCGHRKGEHGSITKECYVVKHLKGSHYQCICRKFEEAKG